jgi:hypothetical protein
VAGVLNAGMTGPVNEGTAHLSGMHPAEYWGRITLAIAVALLFLTVVASMIAGRALVPAFVVVGVLGAVGGAAMLLGRERY